jgi:hypothetical protein
MISGSSKVSSTSPWSSALAGRASSLMTPVSPSYRLIVSYCAQCSSLLVNLTNLEGALSQDGFEVVGLTDEDDLVDVEFMSPTDDLAVGMLVRDASPRKD